MKWKKAVKLWVRTLLDGRQKPWMQRHRVDGRREHAATNDKNKEIHLTKYLQPPTTHIPFLHCVVFGVMMCAPLSWLSLRNDIFASGPQDSRCHCRPNTCKRKMPFYSLNSVARPLKSALVKWPRPRSSSIEGFELLLLPLELRTRRTYSWIGWQLACA